MANPTITTLRWVPIACVLAATQPGTTSASPPATGSDALGGPIDGATDAPIDGTLDPDPLPAPPPPERFWLSVELIGPRGAQLDAASSLADPSLDATLPRRGAPPPGEYVGAVVGLAEALRWVDRHAFSVALGDRAEDRAEAPGGQLLAAHDVVLTALLVSRAGSPDQPWPAAHAMEIPDDLDWQPASLAVARAPLFALPSGSHLPARERYREATLADSIWIREEGDHCVVQDCSSWAQVLVRRGDRFFGGWLPSVQVIPDLAWVGGPREALRRFALRRGHRDVDGCSFALLEQRDAQREPPVGLHHDCIGQDWPPAVVEVLGDQVVVLIERDVALSRHIEPAPLGPLTPSPD